MNPDTQTRVIALIQQQLGIPEVRSEHNIQVDLGADSLDCIELNMAIEEEFDVEISDTIADKLNTVNDIIYFIEQYHRSR